MIAGTMKGLVLFRKEFPDGQRANVCGVLLVQVQDWVFGKKDEQLVEVWIPTYLEKRMSFIMNDKNKYLVINYDWVRGASENVYGDRIPDFGVKMSAVYHG